MNASSSLPAEIFKAYDIRGVFEDNLTIDGVQHIGQAIGSMALAAGDPAVVVGRDGRLSGPALGAALSDGILASGCNVIDIGMVPTPVVYYGANCLETRSCVAITGSHNPPDWNGFKIVIGGETLSGDRIQEIRQRGIDQNFAKGQGSSRHESISDRYVERITSDIKLSRPMEIVIDCGNGVAGELAPRVLEGIGCTVTGLYCEIDGNFPNHHPDPTRPENLVELIDTVKKTDAVLGAGFDGDGDRLGIVAKNGDIVWPDRQMILFVNDILSQNKGAEFIYDVKCSSRLKQAIVDAGGKATMWKTGHSLMKAKLRETGAAMAGEMSGHMFFNDRWYGFDDGIYSAARLCELLSKFEQSPQQLFDSLPNSSNTPEINIAVESDGEQHKIVESLIAAASLDGAQINTIDGLRADYDDGFGLIRASNTTPNLVLRFEGDNDQALQRIQDEFRALISRVQPSIDTGF